MGYARRERNHYEHQCGTKRLLRRRGIGKLRYDNFLDALKAAVRVQRTEPEDHFSVYECGKCGYIHVGRMHPNDILYFEDMPLPTFPAIDEEPNRTPRTALSKQEKRAIVKRSQVRPTSAGLDKVRYPAPIFMPSRGYQPFMHLADEMFGKQRD